MQRSDLVVWLSEVDKEDIELVGKKGGELGEIAKLGIPIRNGFVITTNAETQFFQKNNLVSKTEHLLETANLDNAESLAQISKNIKRFILRGEMSDLLVKQIFRAYRNLGGFLKDTLVTVLSSPVKNQMNTRYFNIKGEANLIQKVREIWASPFDAKALFLKQKQLLDYFKMGTAIIVQKIIKPSQSGVLFTDKTKIVIKVRSETENHYEVSKKNLELINKVIKKGKKQMLTDKQIIDLALYCKKLEKYYYFPQTVKWAIEKNKIYITQTSPIITFHPSLGRIKFPIIRGTSVSPGIATGYLRIIRHTQDVNKVLPGEIIVISYANRGFNQAVKKAGAVVIESKFYKIPYLTIFPRLFGKPAIATISDVTKILKNGLFVTVNGTKGKAYQGSLWQK